MNEITYLASDIMTSPVVTVGPDVTVAEAASLMLSEAEGSSCGRTNADSAEFR